MFAVGGLFVFKCLVLFLYALDILIFSSFVHFLK